MGISQAKSKNVNEMEPGYKQHIEDNLNQLKERFPYIGRAMIGFRLDGYENPFDATKVVQLHETHIYIENQLSTQSTAYDGMSYTKIYVASDSEILCPFVTIGYSSNKYRGTNLDYLINLKEIQAKEGELELKYKLIDFLVS